MILYVVFSYIFMFGFAGYSDKVKATTKRYSVTAFILAPLSMPMFLGLSLAVWMDEE